jgi:[ribosomal protein S5]-alanine N-acetyltransferase
MTEPGHFFRIDKDFYLRPLERTDLEGGWAYWFNDPEVTKFTATGYYPHNAELQAKYFDRLMQSDSDVVLAVIDRSNDRHIGNVGLHRIERIHRTAYLGIVLGEKSAWGRGIGSRCWQAITDYGFSVLNLQKICATIVDGNDGSMKCALKAGYKVEGRQVRQMYKSGSYVDLIYVGLLRADWNG